VGCNELDHSFITQLVLQVTNCDQTSHNERYNSSNVIPVRFDL
jgi:hypothetical protein